MPAYLESSNPAMRRCISGSVSTDWASLYAWATRRLWSQCFAAHDGELAEGLGAAQIMVQLSSQGAGLENRSG